MQNQIKIGFSLDMINMHHQEPNRNRQESKYYWEELYPLIVAAGFHGIEMPFDPFWIFRGGSGVPFTNYCIDIKYKNVDNYLKYLKDKGIDKVAGINFSPQMFMRNEDLNFYFGASGHFGGEAIRFASELGCDYINVTPTAPYGLITHYHGKNAEAHWEKDFIKRTIEMINKFAETAAQHSIKLVLKNEYWGLFRGNKISEYLSEMDDSIRLNIDTAHLSISGLNSVEFFKEHAPKIGSVNLTDTAFVDEDDIWKTANPEYPETKATQVFRDLGFGNLDLISFYQALNKTDYDGWVICSCRQTRDPMRALLRSRSFIDNNILMT
ncbi:sugar phosphate isomerase/epimerase family protein [Confluentibacter flavum]|nr:sugar phosphate isomerase/epimerase [Confluentibacter flavum]